jgi:hypothetical protein
VPDLGEFRGPSDEGVSKTREKATDPVTGGLPKGWMLVVLSDRVLELMVRRQLVATTEAGGKLRVRRGGDRTRTK